MKTFLSLFLLASIAFVPVIQAQPRGVKAKGAIRPPLQPRTFVFRESAQVGDKFVWSGRSETRIEGQLAQAQKQHYSEELVKKEGNRFIWRVASSEQEVNVKAPKDGGKPKAIKVKTYIRNGFGNLVGFRGTKPDTPVTYGEWPEVPVHVGSTWKSRTVSQGKSYPNVHSLKAIKTIAGQEYLLITVKSESGFMPEQTKWFVFAIHQSAKIEAKDEATLEGGQKAIFRGTYHLLNKNGRVLLP